MDDWGLVSHQMPARHRYHANRSKATNRRAVIHHLACVTGKRKFCQSGEVYRAGTSGKDDQWSQHCTWFHGGFQGIHHFMGLERRLCSHDCTHGSVTVQLSKEVALQLDAPDISPCGQVGIKETLCKIHRAGLSSQNHIIPFSGSEQIRTYRPTTATKAPALKQNDGESLQQSHSESGRHKEPVAIPRKFAVLFTVGVVLGGINMTFRNSGLDCICNVWRTWLLRWRGRGEDYEGHVTPEEARPGTAAKVSEPSRLPLLVSTSSTKRYRSSSHAPLLRYGNCFLIIAHLVMRPTQNCSPYRCASCSHFVGTFSLYEIIYIVRKPRESINDPDV